MSLIGQGVAVLCLAVGALGTVGACTSESAASGGSADTTRSTDATAEPLPTIGLGSDASPTPNSGIGAVNADEVDSIVMIGDSITVASTPELERQFAEIGFDDVDIIAQDGKRMGFSFGDNPSGVAIADLVAQDDVEPGERLWIIALGTNDIGNYSDPAEVRRVIESVLDEVPDDAPLIWIDTYIADRLEDTASMNALIESVIAERENATVGAWHTPASTDGVLRIDGVHPNDQGVITFAGVVTSTAANFLGR